MKLGAVGWSGVRLLREGGRTRRERGQEGEQEEMGHFTEGAEEASTGLIATSALDALVDGLVLGLGFNAGQKQGTLLASALAIEFLFLGL